MYGIRALRSGGYSLKFSRYHEWWLSALGARFTAEYKAKANPAVDQVATAQPVHIRISHP